MKTLEFISDPESLQAQPLDEPPSDSFIELVDSHGPRLADLALRRKLARPRLDSYDLRLGMVFPPHAVLSEEIRGLCAIPFRHKDGGVYGCEGTLEAWMGCPPRSPGVAHASALLRASRAMLLLQFDGISDHTQQVHINQFTRRLAEELDPVGLQSPGSFGCGPCTLCKKEGCVPDGEECRLPGQHTFALESCGFWVTHLCRMAARHPLTLQAPREIEWVTDWNLPGQHPATFRCVTGVLIS